MAEFVVKAMVSALAVPSPLALVSQPSPFALVSPKSLRLDTPGWDIGAWVCPLPQMVYHEITSVIAAEAKPSTSTVAGNAISTPQLLLSMQQLYHDSYMKHILMYDGEDSH